MKPYILVLLTILFANVLTAQINFEKTYPSQWSLNNPNDIEQTSDGGFIIGAGSLIKTDNFGDTVWTKTHFLTGQFSNINGVTQTIDGGYAYVISTNTGVTWNTTLVKTNSIGTSSFIVTYGGAVEIMVPILLKLLTVVTY
jgi:restriction endonuclease S subunit